MIMLHNAAYTLLRLMLMLHGSPADVCDVITAVAHQLASNGIKVDIGLNIYALQSAATLDGE